MHLNFLTSGVLWVTSITWRCVHCSFRLVSWTGPWYSLCHILGNYCTFPRISCHAIKQAVSPNHKLQICVPSRFPQVNGLTLHVMKIKISSWKLLTFDIYVWVCFHKTNEWGFASNWVLWKQTSVYSTDQATGIAALHACFMSGNSPYCTQIPQEKHAWNTRVKKYTQKYTRKYM